jgi:hypothetical protein
MVVLVMTVIAAAAFDVHRRCRRIGHHLREIRRLRRELREAIVREGDEA